MTTSSQQAADQCPECDGAIAQTRTDHHCRQCGLVITDTPIDARADWTENADGEDNPGRGVTDRTFAGNAMGSEIGYDEDIADRKREWNRRAKVDNKRERNQSYLTGEVRRIVSALELPESLQDQAAQLMTTLYDETDDLNGKDLDTVAATGAYVVARVRQRGVSASEVVEVARDVEEKILLRRRTWLCQTLGLSIPTADHEQRLTVVADRLDLPDETIRQARAMLDAFDDMDRQRGKPSSIVAMVLWRVSDRTQAEVGDAAGVTPHTIRNCDGKLPNPDQMTLAQY